MGYKCNIKKHMQALKKGLWINVYCQQEMYSLQMILNVTD